MEKSRKQKILLIFVLMLSIASLSIGFAAFSVSLNISSSANVSVNSDTFSVKFSTSQTSLVVGDVVASNKTNGITTTNGIIDNSTNPTIKGLTATFTSPGQYAEFTFYARNEGEYTAYLNNINFIGSKRCKAEPGTTDSLVQSACDYINITVNVGGITYIETTPIAGHTLDKKNGEQIKIRLEYDSNGVSVDGSFSIKFPNIAFVYSTLDDSTIQPTIPKVVKLESGDLNTPGSIVSILDEKFYVIGQENGNVKLLSMYNLYVGGKYESGTWTSYGSEATGIQDSTMLGYVSEQSVRNGTTAFSSSNQKGTNYSDYSGSIVEGYVNSYKDYLEDLGVIISKARLIQRWELAELGCGRIAASCSSAPSFVYSTSYWIGEAVNENRAWCVYNYAHYGGLDCHYDHSLGVRPVIEIPLSEFEKA